MQNQVPLAASGLGAVGGLLLVGLVMVVLLLLLARARSEGRTQALRAWALHRDWALTGEDRDLAARLHELLPGRGHRRRLLDVVSGTANGLAVHVAECTWETAPARTHAGVGGAGTGPGTDPTERHHRQVLVVEGSGVPGLAVARHRFFSRVAVAFGGADVAVGVPGFDEQWRVVAHGTDGVAAAVRRLVPALSAFPGTCLRSDGRTLVAEHDRLLDPGADLDRWVDGLLAGLTPAPRDS